MASPARSGSECLLRLVYAGFQTEFRGFTRLLNIGSACLSIRLAICTISQQHEPIPTVNE